MQKPTSRNKIKKSESKLKSDLILILACLLIQSVIFVSVSVVSLAMNVEVQLIFPVALVVFSLASAASAFYAGRKIRHNGLIYGILYTLPANITYLLVSLIFNGFKVDYAVILSAALLVASSACGGIFSVNIRKKSKIKR